MFEQPHCGLLISLVDGKSKDKDGKAGRAETRAAQAEAQVRFKHSTFLRCNICIFSALVSSGALYFFIRLILVKEEAAEAYRVLLLNPTLRWEHALPDEEKERARLEEYKEQRRQRYIVQRRLLLDQVVEAKPRVSGTNLQPMPAKVVF